MSLLLSLVAALAAPSSPSVTLEPVGPWELSTDDISCRVSRNYRPDSHFILGFEASAGNADAVVLLAAPKNRLPNGTGRVPVKIDTADRVIDVPFGAFEMTDRSMRLLKLFPDRDALKTISTSKYVEVGNTGVRLGTGNTQVALSSLGACMTKKFTSWGVDPKLYEQHQLAGFKGNIGQWFVASAYPKEALKAGVSGRVVLLVKTDRNGKVTNCQTVSSENSLLDAGTCAIAKEHLQFKAPVGSNGQPIDSYAIVPIRWTLP